MISQGRAASADAVLRAIDTRLDGTPLALMLDVDGTISPIAPAPEQALVPIETRNTIRRLVEAPGVHVALVTGRPVSDAQRMVMVDGVWVLGNHGLEIGGPGTPAAPVPKAHGVEAAMVEARHMLAPMVRATPGALVDDKRLTLSVHYRLARPEQGRALVALARDVARVLGLRATEGRCVVDLRPAIEVDKGTAALEYAERVGALRDGGAVFYAGDDRTDEDAFQALVTHAPGAVTVRVDDDGDEQSAETAAEFRIAGPREVARLLELLLDRRALR